MRRSRPETARRGLLSHLRDGSRRRQGLGCGGGTVARAASRARAQVGSTMDSGRDSLSIGEQRPSIGSRARTPPESDGAGRAHVPEQTRAAQGASFVRNAAESGSTCEGMVSDAAGEVGGLRASWSTARPSGEPRPRPCGCVDAAVPDGHSGERERRNALGAGSGASTGVDARSCREADSRGAATSDQVRTFLAHRPGRSGAIDGSPASAPAPIPPSERTPPPALPADAGDAMRRCLGCGVLIRRGSRCGSCATARRGGSGWARQRQSAEVLAAAGGRCAMCGGPAHEVDHIVPLSRGGADDASNKQALCTRDHAAKTRGVGGSNLCSTEAPLAPSSLRSRARESRGGGS